MTTYGLHVSGPSVASIHAWGRPDNIARRLFGVRSRTAIPVSRSNSIVCGGVETDSRVWCTGPRPDGARALPGSAETSADERSQIREYEGCGVVCGNDSAVVVACHSSLRSPE